MVGMRRGPRTKLFLLNRQLTAKEAIDFSLVSRLAPSDAVESELAAIASTLAAGLSRREKPAIPFGLGPLVIPLDCRTGLS